MKAKYPRTKRAAARASKRSQMSVQIRAIIKALKEETKSSASVTIDGPASAVVFADMKDSTPESEKTPDNWFAQLVFNHNGILIRAFAEYGGRYIKEVGDEVILCLTGGHKRANAATRAILGAVLAQRTLAAFNKTKRPKLRVIKTQIGIVWVPESQTFDRLPRIAEIRVAGKTVETAPDLLGFHVNRAARIASIAEPEQVVIDESMYKRAQKSLLTQAGVRFSEPRVFRKLKGVEEEVLVREVIYSNVNKQIGLGENTIESLALIDLPHKENSRRLLNQVRKVFEEKGLFPDQLLYANLLFGSRSLVLRLRAFDLEEHKEIMTEVLRTLIDEVDEHHKSSIMAHSFFIYGGSRHTGSLEQHSVLVLFGLYADSRENMERFLQFFFDGRHRIQVYDCGLLFGEFEAFAILSASEAYSLSDMLMKREWALKHSNVTVRHFEVYPMWQRNQRPTSLPRDIPASR